MKAIPDKTDVEHDVETTDGPVGVRDTLVEYDDKVIAVYSSQSDAEEGIAWGDKGVEEEGEEEESEDYDEDCGRHKSKKKKKHHHKHHDSRIRKKHKKRKKRVDPIFLWAQKREAKIVRVVCENYDRQNRIRLVRTSSGLWTSNPRSKVLAASQSRSSVYEEDDESPKDTDAESTVEPDEKRTEINNAEDKKPKEIEQQQQSLVDLNDNSIEFGDTICSEEDEEERARIDRALEMIERDPALLVDMNATLPTIEHTRTTLKLPEGTTIHQVKTENTLNKSVVESPSPPQTPSSPISPSPSLTKLPIQCTFGEITIIPQQQQNEPLNLESVGKRSALEIRLQEPPLKKKRVVQSLPLPLPPPPSLPLVDRPVKREWDPLSELKEVLSDPRLCVPDPLLVPRARLAALVASPATEIPKLLQAPSILPPPPPDPDLLTVSLSHLRSILQQQLGFTDEQKTEGNNHQSSSNMDQMLWLSYLSSKDMTGVDADLLTNMLSILLPNSSTVQQSFNYPQQNNQWNNMAYYGGNLTPTAYGSTPSYSKSDDCCASVSPLSLPLPHSQPPSHNNVPPVLETPQKHLRQSPLLPSSRSHRNSPLLPPPSAAHSRPKSLLPSSTPMVKQQQPPNKPPIMCQDLCCNGPAPSCCESCCSKPSGCNPYTMSSPMGCNPFVMSPTGCVGNLKNCTTYSSDGGSGSCCFSADIGCGYDGQSTPRKPSLSPGNRVQLNYHKTGFGQQQKQQHQKPIVECDVGSVSGNIGGDNQTASKPPTTTSSLPPANNISGSDGNASGEPPLQRPKIKVKQHLVDPNAKPKLLNFEGALHLAGANPHDLFSSPLWHPLFGR